MTDLDDDTLLSRLRQWLWETRAEAEAEAESLDDDGEEATASDIGLYRLVEEFTALRQEVKLQTKGGRGLQEQAESLLPAIRQAIETFRSVEPREEQAAQAAGRPIAEALADLDEALERGRLEIEKIRGRLAADLASTIESQLDALLKSQPWYRRIWLRRYHAELRALVSRHSRETLPELFDALLEGYSLIQSRLRRALIAGQIQWVDAVGQPADPERMTVIEVVHAPELPPGQVVEELRRGYTWRGRVLRYAEVRAVSHVRPGGNPIPEFTSMETESETHGNNHRD
jgi:molecular chaperone GrpE